MGEEQRAETVVAAEGGDQAVTQLGYGRGRYETVRRTADRGGLCGARDRVPLWHSCHWWRIHFCEAMPWVLW